MHTTFSITITGARGGSGTSTVAAALALFSAGHANTELIAAEPATTAALLGLPAAEGTSDPIAVTERLTLVAAPTGRAEVVVTDAGRLDELPARPDGVLLAVLRGPCYVGLRSLVTGGGERPDGIVLLSEAGRSLTRRDVADVSGVEVVAEIPVTPAVARTIDAGLLPARAGRLGDLAALRRYATRLLTPAPVSPAADPDPLDPLAACTNDLCVTPDRASEPVPTSDTDSEDGWASAMLGW